MAIQITAVRLTAGGTTHEHITRLWWTTRPRATPATATGRISSTGSRTSPAGPTPATRPDTARKSASSRPRTHADGVWTDNLLALPGTRPHRPAVERAAHLAARQAPISPSTRSPLQEDPMS